MGKTTLSASTALACARRGHRTLAISTDVAHNLADVLDVTLGNDPVPVAGQDNLWAAELDTSQELERYWGNIRARLTAVLRDKGMPDGIAGELAVLPGLDEIIALLRIREISEAGEYDTLVIDSAPTGAAMRLLSAPDLARWYTRNIAGLSRGLMRFAAPALRKATSLPITEQAVQSQLEHIVDEINDLRAILTDGEHTSVRLVLNPETMAVRETQRAFTYASLFGLSVDALFVNRLYPDTLEDTFFERWKVDQRRLTEDVKEMFAPLPVFEVPLMPSEVLGVEALVQLAEGLFGELDPHERLSSEDTLWFYAEGEQQIMALRISGVSSQNIELEKHGDELMVRLGNNQRRLVLPAYLAAMQPTSASIQEDTLRIYFSR